MEQEFIQCESCHQDIPRSNYLIHSARCTRENHKNATAQINNTEDDYEMVENDNITNTSQSLPSTESINYWTCDYCHIENTYENTKCVCCSKTYQPLDNNNNETEEDANTWPCPICTLKNPINRSKCELCDSYRQPSTEPLARLQPTYYEETETPLTHDEEAKEEDEHTHLLPSQSATVTDRHTSNEISDLNSIMTSTFVGALSGASIGAATNRNFLSSMLSGALIGAATGLLGSLMALPSQQSEPTWRDTEAATVPISASSHATEVANSSTSSIDNTITCAQPIATARANTATTSDSLIPHHPSSQSSTSLVTLPEQNNTSSIHDTTAETLTNRSPTPNPRRLVSHTHRTTDANGQVYTTYAYTLSSEGHNSDHNQSQANNEGDGEVITDHTSTLIQFLLPFLPNFQVVFTTIQYTTTGENTTFPFGGRNEEVRRGLTEDEISALPSKLVTDSVLETCSTCHICLDDFVQDSYITCLSCDHMYHKHCIAKWLKRSELCPLCKHNATSDGERAVDNERS